MIQKTLKILGSTGSIGKSALRVADFLRSEIRVTGLSCSGNIAELKNQIKAFRPDNCAVTSEAALLSEDYKLLKKQYNSVNFFEGRDGLKAFAGEKSDITLSSIVGAAGLEPGLIALESSKRMALANKESLVMAGKIFMERAKSLNTEIIPVDSEHSAIFSIIENMDPLHIERIILTASGGSLRNHSISQLENVTPREALAHPTWNMGDKITIDSATLINKGLEVIEAHHLFSIDYNSIDVIIHPESVIHSMVETIDGAVYAHMGEADMAFPILNALKYPDKTKNPFGRINLSKIASLNFSEYDRNRYPGLELCYNAGSAGGTLPAVLNAANEEAVNAFLANRILFTDIVKIIEKVVSASSSESDPTLEKVLDADREARLLTQKYL